MNNIKAYTAGSDIEGNRFITFDTAEGVVKMATASSVVIGTTGYIGSVAEKIVDVDHNRLVEVQVGGTVAVGDGLISDANGKAVKAGEGVSPIAIALASGTADAIIFVLMK
ncbi:MAG: hypothetical protein ACK5N8_02240 [Alphaproteobacteria bacterium]